jgi:hypothetical protein
LTNSETLKGLKARFKAEASVEAQQKKKPLQLHQRKRRKAQRWQKSTSKEPDNSVATIRTRRTSEFLPFCFDLKPNTRPVHHNTSFPVTLTSF